MNYEEGIAMKFTVLYKLWNHPRQERGDWICSSLQELMGHLARDGITKETVDFLYVHYYVPQTNEVMEMVAWDNKGNSRAKVVDLNAAREERLKKADELLKKTEEAVSPRKKLRVRLKNKSVEETTTPPPVVHQVNLYKAMQV